jgi:hypothetical protein
MLKKFCHLSLVSAAWIGFISLPASADTATAQSGSQDTTISGDNNQVTQIINQTVINHPGRGALNRASGKKKDETCDRGNRYRNQHQDAPGDRNRKNR